MDGYKAYRYYLAIKLHFTTDSSMFLKTEVMFVALVKHLMLVMIDTYLKN